jgi:hypothetical protein
MKSFPNSIASPFIKPKKKNEPLEKRSQKANVQLSSKKCDVIGNQK